MRRLGDRLAASLIDHARLMAVVLLLITAGTLWQATQLRINVDLTGLIGPQSDGALAIRDYTDRFGPLREDEVLLITAPTLASDAALSALEDLLLDIQFVDGVEQVISLFSLSAPGRAGSWLADPDLSALPPRLRLETLRSADPLAEQLISADLTGTIVVVAPAPGTPSDAFLAALDTATGASALQVSHVGLAASQRAVAAELIRDLSVLTPAAVGICIVFGLFMLRNLRAVFVCALPPVMGLIWFGGWLGATSLAVDPVMGALPVVLIVLGFSDAMHLYHAALHEDRGTHARNVQAALIRTVPAAVQTSLTTMIAFALLILPDSPSLNQMATAGVGGMVLTLAAVLLLTPVLMALLGTPARGEAVPPTLALLVSPAQRMMRWRGVPLLALAVLGLMWLGQSQSQPGFRYADYLPVGAPVTEALMQAEALGLSSDRLLVVVEAAPAIGPGPDANARAAALALWGADRAGWLDSTAGAEMLGRMQAPDGSAHALPVQLPISATGAAADASLRAIEDQLDRAGLAGHARLVGPGHALATEGPRLAESLRTGLYLTIGAATLLIGLIHRSLRIAAVSLVPNLIPILGIEAWLFVTGRELTIMNMIALTVAFGIAVDDTLHFLNRLRLAGPGSPTDRLDRAIYTAGPPMAATSLVLIAGVAVTLTSALPGAASFGLLIALAVAIALCADLFLFPGLLRWSLR